MGIHIINVGQNHSKKEYEYVYYLCNVRYEFRAKLTSLNFIMYGCYTCVNVFLDTDGQALNIYHSGNDKFTFTKRIHSHYNFIT